MCGVAGFVDRGGGNAPEALRQRAWTMASALRHRGPDDAGVWTDAGVQLALAHRRLAILERSAAGHQPMVSSCGRFVLSYNGEIYNHLALRHELAGRSRRLRGRSDTEALVEACAEWGVEEALRRIEGMFAFGLWDRQSRTLTLARDRIGIKPLYWARFGQLLLFGSELAALRAHPGWQPEIDPASLAAFTRWGHVPAPFSIYRNVFKLLPGQYLRFEADGELRLESYWDPARSFAAAQEEGLRIRKEEATRRLRSLLAEAVGRRMMADVPVGAFLSGGLDSSLVVALMRRQSSAPVKTFGVGFTERRYDESAEARATARHLGTEHTEIVISPADVPRLAQRAAEVCDEPLAVRSQMPALAVAELARRQVTVALSGDGGDELFGGYPGYFLAHALQRAVAPLPVPLRRAGASLLRGLIGTVSLAQRALPRSRRPSLPVAQLRRLADALGTGGLPELYAELYSAVGRRPPLLRMEDEHPMYWQCPPHRDLPGDPIARMGYFALLGTLVDRTLAKLDRTTMAFGLEARVPFLDLRVVEYAWRLPPALKRPDRAGVKPLLRSILRNELPAELVDRPKKGFSSPLPVWLRGALRPWVEELLDEGRLRRQGIFDPVVVRSRWQRHLAGLDNDWQFLWSLLVFQHWQERWMKGAAGRDGDGAAGDLALPVVERMRA